ncbi:GntR family transcriptional regulator [Actinocatenispora thailandica]|uniref:GntR family transcriptional regulator n=1 Tax=Actinocatenispora thailandica TaxID=227318 RepID=UPI001951C40F|nr:GntR family transcriptional regulator [Actinocatenispora thailandica]
MARPRTLKPGRPAYQQIADELRASIRSGELGDGDQLPSETQLIETFGVARMTVRAALQVLQHEGLAVAEHGRGVFVRQRRPFRRRSVQRLSRSQWGSGRAMWEADTADDRTFAATIDVTRERATDDVAERLRIPSGTDVVVRRRLHSVDGQPLQLSAAHLPADIAAGTAIAEPDAGPGGTYARLEELGHPLERFVEEVQARMPSPDEARLLVLPAGVPVITVVRVAHTSERPVEVNEIVVNSDLYVLEYEIRP